MPRPFVITLSRKDSAVLLQNRYKTQKSGNTCTEIADSKRHTVGIICLPKRHNTALENGCSAAKARLNGIKSAEFARSNAATKLHLQTQLLRLRKSGTQASQNEETSGSPQTFDLSHTSPHISLKCVGPRSPEDRFGLEPTLPIIRVCLDNLSCTNKINRI